MSTKTTSTRAGIQSWRTRTVYRSLLLALPLHHSVKTQAPAKNIEGAAVDKAQTISQETVTISSATDSPCN